MIAELFYMDVSIWARTPYNADFVNDLKDEIPKDYRRWDKEERVWVISYVYEKEILDLCSSYFDKVIQHGEKRYSTILSPPAYKTLHLLPSAPKEVVVAAYRVLARLYHPDLNKDKNATEKMKGINVAFDTIMGRR